MNISSLEKQGFSIRLRSSIEAKGCRNSASELSALFNDSFQGKPITSHTARNWLLGNSLPSQDKLVCLAKLFDTSPEHLRFGLSSEKSFEIDGQIPSIGDHQFFKNYLNLSAHQQRIVRELVIEFQK